MSAHLAHKIPWEWLCDLYVERRASIGRHKLSAVHEQKLGHFGRAMAQTIQDFQVTATSTLEEQAALNPQQWGIDWKHCMGAYTGYVDSILWGYMELNMLLTDPHRIAPLLRSENGRCCYMFKILLGHYDGGHPEHIASNLTPAFDDVWLKPLAAEVLQILRDHAALLFRCMYLAPNGTELFDAREICAVIRSFSDSAYH